MSFTTLRVGEGHRFTLTRVLTVGDTDVIFGATDKLRGDDEVLALRTPLLAHHCDRRFVEEWEAAWRRAEGEPGVGARTVVATGRHNGLPFAVHPWVPGVDFLSLSRCAAVSRQTIPRRFSLSAVALAAAAHQEAETMADRADDAPRMAGRLGPHRILITPRGHITTTAIFASESKLARWPVPSDPGEYAFRAPELLRGDVGPYRGDAWAIGVWIRAIQTGSIPTESGGLPETAERILSAESTPSMGPVGDDLALLADALLDPQPETRLPLGALVLSALRREIQREGGMPTPTEWCRLLARLNPPSRTRQPPVALNGPEVGEVLARLRTPPTAQRWTDAAFPAPRARRSLRLFARGLRRATTAARTGPGALLLSTLAVAVIAGSAASAVAGSEPDAGALTAPLGNAAQVVLQPTITNGALIMRVRWPSQDVGVQIGRVDDPGQPSRLRITADSSDAKVVGHTWYFPGQEFERVDIEPAAGGFTIEAACRDTCPSPSFFSSGRTGLVMVVGTPSDHADPAGLAADVR